MRHDNYIVLVKDPVTDAAATYLIQAVSIPHAVRQAKDGFTGLLGDMEAVQERLIVKAQRLD